MSEIEGLILSPHESDGRKVVVVSPSTEGWMTWFTGAGDDLDTGERGGGQQLTLTFSGQNSAGSEIAIQMIEPVELHDGQLFYNPDDWNMEDRWDFSVRMPATTANTNPTSSGNCNLVDLGGYNLIVPSADQTGTHDINLATAVPVPASGNTGYWDADHDTGAVTPSATPGEAEWHLMDVQIDSYFMKNMPLGCPLGTFNVDAYKAEWISQNWQIVLKVYRNTTGLGTFKVGGWLMLFREHST